MASETHISVPSGQPVTLFEIIEGQGAQAGTWFFRFLAPELGADIDYDALAPDLEVLCRDVALAKAGGKAERVVISMAARKMPFGVPAPEVVQVFEAYVIADGTCRWEPL